MDRFTSTVDAAAAYERWHSVDYDDAPTLGDVMLDPAESAEAYEPTPLDDPWYDPTLPAEDPPF